MSVHLCVFCSLCTWRSWSRRHGVRDTTTFNVQAYMVAFLNIALMSAFFVKSKTFCLGTCFFKCWIIRISKLWDIRLKEFCCILLSICDSILHLLVYCCALLLFLLPLADCIKSLLTDLFSRHSSIQHFDRRRFVGWWATDWNSCKGTGNWRWLWWTFTSTAKKQTKQPI